MANVIIDDTHLTNIADAIRSKNGSVDTYTPAQMAAAISAIETGGGSSAFNALLASQDGNYHCSFKIVTASSNTFRIDFSTSTGLTNTKQIRYIVILTSSSSSLANQSNFIYDRSSWLDYSYRTEYSSYAIVPFTSMNLHANSSTATHHKGFWSFYSSPSASGKGFRKIDLENNNLTLQVYDMITTGNKLGSATNPQTTVSYYAFAFWDDISCIPTE